MIRSSNTVWGRTCSMARIPPAASSQRVTEAPKWVRQRPTIVRIIGSSSTTTIFRDSKLLGDIPIKRFCFPEAVRYKAENCSWGGAQEVVQFGHFLQSTFRNISQVFPFTDGSSDRLTPYLVEHQSASDRFFPTIWQLLKVIASLHRSHLRHRDHCSILSLIRAQPGVDCCPNKRQPLRQFFAQASISSGHRHLTMMPIEWPKMKLDRSPDQVRTDQKTLDIILRAQMFHYR